MIRGIKRQKAEKRRPRQPLRRDKKNIKDTQNRARIVLRKVAAH